MREHVEIPKLCESSRFAHGRDCIHVRSPLKRKKNASSFVSGRSLNGLPKQNYELNSSTERATITGWPVA
jgi:hypothetical protein